MIKYLILDAVGLCITEGTGCSKITGTTGVQQECYFREHFTIISAFEQMKSEWMRIQTSNL